MRPTEDLDKVKAALAELIVGPVETVSTGQQRYVLRIESDDRSSLERLKMILQRDRIRAAARAILLRSLRDESDTIELYLNKQVAYAGHVSFSEAEGESPLGPIRLTIKSSNLQSTIDWLTGEKATVLRK